MSHEMTFHLNDEVYYRLRELAAKNHVHEGEIIRRALALLSACDEHKPVDGHVIITDKHMKPLVKLKNT